MKRRTIILKANNYFAPDSVRGDDVNKAEQFDRFCAERGLFDLKALDQFITFCRVVVKLRPATVALYTEALNIGGAANPRYFDQAKAYYRLYEESLNAPILTQKDIAEELGLQQSRVSALLRELCIAPISDKTKAKFYPGSVISLCKYHREAKTKQVVPFAMCPDPAENVRTIQPEVLTFPIKADIEALNARIAALEESINRFGDSILSKLLDIEQAWK